MATLSYIGLSYYEVDATQKFINVLFQASTANNTYEYGFSDSTATPPTSITPVPNISTSLPADRPISAKLPYTSGSVVWIRNINTNKVIWQTFNTSDYSPTSGSNSNANGSTINSYNDTNNILTKTTTWGQLNEGQLTTSGTLNTNIYYTSNQISINIPSDTVYDGVKPLYIMSKNTVNLISIKGDNIIIIGTSTEGAAIIISNNASLTHTGAGILTLNGASTTENGIGIYITDITSYSGDITLLGTASDGTAINLQSSLTHTGAGTLTLTGTATGYGIGIFITGETSYSGAITLNGNSGNPGIPAIYIATATLNQTGLGTLALTGYPITFNNANINIYFDSASNHGVLSVATGSIITGTFNFGIAPTSPLQGQSVYSNIMTNIPPSAIANRNTANNTIEGTFGTDPNLIPWTASANTNDWTLATAGACLLEGTLIHTPSGYVLIEHINKGDEVITADNRIVKVISTYHSIMHSDTELYVIKQHSVDVNSPSQDLYVSSGHLVKIHDKYMHPIHLKSPLIEKCDGMRELSFYHLELENFKTDFLRANNLEVESYRNDNIHHTKWDCSGDECIMLLD
jgi:hypothetical protein